MSTFTTLLMPEKPDSEFDEVSVAWTKRVDRSKDWENTG